MARPTQEQCKKDFEAATAELGLFHIAAMTGLRYTDIRKLFADQPNPPNGMFEQLQFLFDQYRSFKKLSDLEGMVETARDHDKEYQAVRYKKAQADEKELDIKKKEQNYAKRDDLELVLSFAAQQAATHFSGLTAEIESLVPDLKAHVIDAIEARIVRARNAFADVKLPD